MQGAVAAAYALYGTKRYAEAANQCAEILLREPEQFDALYLQGLIRHRLGDKIGGQSLVDRACSVCPEVKRFDHLAGLLQQHDKLNWLSLHETRLRGSRPSRWCNSRVGHRVIEAPGKAGELLRVEVPLR